MAHVFYESGWEALNGLDASISDIDLLADDIKVALVDSSYVPSAAVDVDIGDISGEIVDADYTTGGFSLTGKTVTQDTGSRSGKFLADSVTEWADASFSGVQGLVIYRNVVGDIPDSVLICYIDLFTAKNAPFNIIWNVTGIFNVESEGFVPNDLADLESGALPDGFASTVGNVSVTGAAALGSNFGLQVNTTPLASSYGTFTVAPAQTYFTFENLFDPNSLAMANGDRFGLMFASGGGASFTTLRVDILFSGGNYLLNFFVFNDAAGFSQTGFFAINDEPQKIRIIWKAGDFALASLGWAVIYIDGIEVGTINTIDNDTYTVTGTRQGALATLDVGTSGNFYMDNLLWDSTVAFPNPIAVEYDMPVDPSSAGNTLSDTIIEAIGFANVQDPTVQQLGITIGFSKPELTTPGLAEYKVKLKDQSGIVVAEFDTWRALNFTHKTNNRGTVRFEINASDDRTSLFILDSQIEVWRKNALVDLDWYIEWEGFYRTNVDKFTLDDINPFIASGFSYADLLRRAEIKYAAETAFADKSGAGETVMKEYVPENIGLGALISNGRDADNIMPGLTVQADTGLGTTWDGERANKNLMETLEKIALKSGIDFDIIGTGAATFEFVTYDGKKTDRTEDNEDGNAPVIFSLGFGNLAIPELTENRSKEVTAAYALGRGVDNARQQALVESLAANDSPWNRIEKTYNASNTEGDSLESAAQENLEDDKFDVTLKFDVLQQVSTYYGKHYTWGDLVTVDYKGNKFDKKLTEVGIDVSANVGGEKISVKFSDN